MRRFVNLAHALLKSYSCLAANIRDVIIGKWRQKALKQYLRSVKASPPHIVRLGKQQITEISVKQDAFAIACNASV